MSDFEAKMHQIRFRLGLGPKPRWRIELTALPRPTSWILRGSTSKGGRKGKDTKGLAIGEMGRKRGKEGRRKGKGRDPPQKNLATGLRVE